MQYSKWKFKPGIVPQQPIPVEGYGVCTVPNLNTILVHNSPSMLHV